tara:strand:+ start:47 stop:640 length:594 start_codon:yes stop_codon:yes gene_type:complete
MIKLPMELPFTEEMILKAEKRAEEMGAINNSILEGEGNKAGFLSEEVFLKYFSDSTLVSQSEEQRYKFDIMLKGLKYELKTMQRTVPASLSHECSVAETSTHQAMKGGADMYVFFSIEFEDEDKKENFVPKAVWLMGCISTKKFYEKAKFLGKGTIDLDNNHKVSQNKYNIQAWRLKHLIKNEFQTNDGIDWDSVKE